MLSVMKLFLLRHAPAEPGSPDAKRALTPAGRRMAEELARFMAERPFFAVQEIWCSPYRRARETAAPVHAALGEKVRLRFRDDLVPHADPAALLPDLRRLDRPLLIVGHNPHLAHLARHALGIHAAGVPFAFKKGAVLALKRDPLSATGFSLAACLPPAALGLKG